MSMDEAIKLFNDTYGRYRQPGDTKFDFYCGITKDLKQRNRQHEVDNVLVSVTAGSFETAAKLEKALQEEGYDVGGGAGHGIEESVIVYMYRKGPDTVE